MWKIYLQQAIEYEQIHKGFHIPQFHKIPHNKQINTNPEYEDIGKPQNTLNFYNIGYNVYVNISNAKLQVSKSK